MDEAEVVAALSFSGSAFQLAAQRCFTQPAVSSISPTGDRSQDRSISRVAEPRCSDSGIPVGLKLANTKPR